MRSRALLALSGILVHLFAPVPYRYEEGPPIVFENVARLPGKVIDQAPPKMIPVDIGDAVIMEYQPPEFSLPVDWGVLSREQLQRPHHDYPAADLGMPVGTNVFAIRGGVVIRAASSNGRCGGQVTIDTDVGKMMYCHLSAVSVSVGDYVATADPIGLSGGKRGAKGAGSSTSPHLHVAIQRNGRDVCPQPLLISIYDQVDPDLTDTTRCHT